MKIDSSYKPPQIGSPPSPPAKANPQASALQSAEVHLSQAAAQLSAGDSATPINRAKIEEIKLAISEGKFKINPEVIADELISTSRRLIESQRREA